MIGVSVIIIAYNTEKYIKKCIQSVISQSLKNIEIICIDDGSTDNTLTIMAEMASLDNRIKIYTQENKGPFSARNRGLNIAKGKYIVFVDSDDWIESSELEDSFSILEKYELNMVFFDYVKENIYTKKMEPNPLTLPANCIIEQEEIKKIIFPKCMQNTNYSSPCTKMIRKEYIDSHMVRLETKLRYGEDLLFLLELYNNLEKTYYIPRHYYHYCVHSNESLSQRHTNEAFFLIHKELYKARKPYALAWNVEKTLYANTAYLGLGELIFDIRQKCSLSIVKKYLSDEIFAEVINNSDNISLYEISKSKKMVLLRDIIYVILKLYNK